MTRSSMIFGGAGLFLAGAFLGFGGCYIYLNKLYDKRLEEELRLTKVNNEKKEVKKPEVEEEPKNDILQSSQADEEKSSEDFMKTAKEYYEKVKIYDYTAPTSVKEEELAEMESPKDDVILDEPYEIDEVDFCETMADYDKISLTYFVEDKTLMDDLTENIMSISDTLGDKGSERLRRFGFGEHSDVPIEETLYFRDDKIAIDYEVVINPNSYRFEVYGEY